MPAPYRACAFCRDSFLTDPNRRQPPGRKACASPVNLWPAYRTLKRLEVPLALAFEVATGTQNKKGPPIATLHGKGPPRALLRSSIARTKTYSINIRVLSADIHTQTTMCERR